MDALHLDHQGAIQGMGGRPYPGVTSPSIAFLLNSHVLAVRPAHPDRFLKHARSEHTQAVKKRIDSVGQLRDVVEVTKGLFALSSGLIAFLHHDM